VREALGRSRGGYGTKACVITDGAGRAISFARSGSRTPPGPLARDLVDCLPDVPGVGDKGYASHAFRQFIWDQGARPRATKRPSPARAGSTTIATASSACGRASRNGAPPLRENRQILHRRALSRRRLRLDRLDDLVKLAPFSQGDDHARIERSIQLVIRALQLVAQSRQQTGNVVRQSEVAEVAAQCRWIVEAARREGLRIGDNDNLV
jgi:hypothetical protein